MELLLRIAGPASVDDPQAPQDLAKIDGPTDADALGRKQAVVVRVPHALVPILGIPTDRDSDEGPLRILTGVRLGGCS